MTRAPHSADRHRFIVDGDRLSRDTVFRGGRWPAELPADVPADLPADLPADTEPARDH
jgi:hypothetical protein